LGQKVLTQFHDGGLGNDAVHGNGELRLPARGDALDPIGHGVNVFEQARTFVSSNSCPAAVSLAWRALRSNSKHVQRVLNLTHPVGQGAGHHAGSALAAAAKLPVCAMVCNIERASGVSTLRACLHGLTFYIQLV
jgi:hypothetical protein